MARSISTAVDSADFFVQSSETMLANFVATATGFVGLDQQNTLQKGLVLSLVIASISVNTATLAVNIDMTRSDGSHLNVVRVSLDGLTAGNSGQAALISMYAGATGTPPGALSPAATNFPLTAKHRVTATLSITTTASMSGVFGYSVGQSKVM